MYRMPFIMTGNTNAPAMMIGEKGADFITKDHLKKRNKYRHRHHHHCHCGCGCHRHCRCGCCSYCYHY